jgi:succinyl-CoA synthetase beta subunit
MKTCSKPIFPILPSIHTARQEVEFFLSKGHINFPDEVLLGKAVSLVHNTPKPAEEKIILEGVFVPEIRRIIERSENGFLPPDEVNNLLRAASIPLVKSGVVTTVKQALSLAEEIGYPVVMKVVGPVHKTETGGVVLNINTDKHLQADFARLRKIPGATAVQIQPMISGIELFIGAKYEPTFGHVMLCGLGGIFVEVLKDVSSGLAPLTYNETFSMIRSVKSYKIMKGARGKEGINERIFADIIVRLSSLLRFAVEIKELDLNPLIGKGDSIQVVDARIRIEK